MIQVQTQQPLQSFNTLNLVSMASDYVQIHSKDDLLEALAYAELKKLNIVILSGGSNVLLPKTLNALVIHIFTLGITLTRESKQYVYINVGAGENWHEFVQITTKNKWFGLQNLALIPGRVGASPVQNIGAYGVEVGEFIESVEVYDRYLNEFIILDQSQCNFSYRDSLFKQNAQRYIILNVLFKLNKQPILKLAYGDLKKAVGNEQTPENLENQVISIRQEKLPNPLQYPNAGSFFKNPIISSEAYQVFAKAFPSAPHYVQVNSDVKLAAGWLIEQAQWKGKKLGCVGMFEKQALVLVNYENATLEHVRHLYQAVQQDVLQMFNITLEPEPVLFDEYGAICSHNFVANI